jgi:ABC-2 type transport system ATP-binding protein
MIKDPFAKLILNIGKLRVSYSQKVAVDDISFSIKQGEIFGLLGPNGAGKTSALSAIEGLVKPESGMIVIGGVDAIKHPLEAKANMGIQLQSTSFHSELTINQIIQLYAGLYGLELSGSEVGNSLKEIGLDSEANQRFKQLSGGQQQRLSLYIATIHNPSLLLLDEPTSGLDPQSRRQLWDRMEHSQRRGGSVLLTTHSMEEAQAVCDRLAIIDHGKIITIETPAGLIKKHKDDPRVLKAARGKVTLEDVFIGLTGSEVRD